MTKTAGVIIVLLATACGGPDYPYYFGGPAITDYRVSPDVVTPDGIRVDTSGNAVDLQLLDDMTSDFGACAGITVDRSGIVAKIVPDWYVSPCSGAQLFPCDLGEQYIRQLEEQTGKKAAPECPWACAGAVQPPNVIVLPPNLAAYGHELIHLVLCIDDHADEMFARCE